MEITSKIIDGLKANFLTMDEYFILWCKHYKKPWLTRWKPAEYIYNKLIDNGYLTKNRQISSAGSKLMNSLETDEEIKQRKQIDDGFKEFFYDTWPKDDKFAHFPFSRALRINPKPSKAAYKSAIEDGVTHEELINAVNAQVESLKKQSMRQASNQLKWLPSPHRWLNEQRYESFVDTTISAQKQSLTSPNKLV